MSDNIKSIPVYVMLFITTIPFPFKLQCLSISLWIRLKSKVKYRGIGSEKKGDCRVCHRDQAKNVPNKMGGGINLSTIRVLLRIL